VLGCRMLQQVIGLNHLVFEWLNIRLRKKFADVQIKVIQGGESFVISQSNDRTTDCGSIQNCHAGR